MLWAGKLRVSLSPRRLIAAPAGALLLLAPLACAPGSDQAVEQPYLPRTAHQAYGHALSQANLVQAALGRDWLSNGEAALSGPREIALPVVERGTFEAATASALGYAFSVPAGKRLEVDFELEADEPFEAFLDLFHVADDGRLTLVASGAPAAKSGERGFRRRLIVNVLEEARYVLRVQPELLRGGVYRVSIGAQPALAFPVEGRSTRAIESGFGAERDGGVRTHRGVDIFAPRGTPALSAIDGWVSRVQTTPIGGNVVWLEDLFSPLRVYYAHLDSQSVGPGDFVSVGDPLGTVGNTGNARTTPPHLHFGVYVRRRGARDPYPFLK
jgi:peptidoglycan LD-endopeptidase LytH